MQWPSILAPNCWTQVSRVCLKYLLAHWHALAHSASGHIWLKYESKRAQTFSSRIVFILCLYIDMNFCEKGVDGVDCKWIWAWKRVLHVACSQSCSITECLFLVIGTVAIKDDIPAAGKWVKPECLMWKMIHHLWWMWFWFSLTF